METLQPPIRNAVRALILRQDQVLLLRKDGDDRGLRYALPGGGQDLGESLLAALQRECREEIGVAVEVIGLVHVADFFKQRDSVPPSTRHLVEFLFHCSVADDYLPHNGHHPDKHQLEVVWVDVAELHRLPLFPPVLADVLQRLTSSGEPVYLGTWQT